MSFPLPPQGHKARALFDLPTLVETLAPQNVGKLPAIWQARVKAMEFFAAEPAARRIAYVIVRYDTAERWLVSFGRKGGWRKEWNFGTGST